MLRSVPIVAASPAVRARETRRSVTEREERREVEGEKRRERREQREETEGNKGAERIERGRVCVNYREASMLLCDQMKHV